VGVKETFGDTIRIFIVIHMLMVAAMLQDQSSTEFFKRSGSEKNGEEPHNPVLRPTLDFAQSEQIYSVIELSPQKLQELCAILDKFALPRAIADFEHHSLVAWNT